MISDLAADIIGLAGSATVVGAFLYVNFARNMDKALYNLANLLGAIFLLVSLLVHFNLAAIVLQVVWGFIAIIGLGQALVARRRRSS